MPGVLVGGDHGISAVAAVAAVAGFLDELLSHAATVKPTASVEPPLEKSNFENLQARLTQALGTGNTQNGTVLDPKKTRFFAIIETAVRDRFINMIASTCIESPEFVNVWNLLDILSILSDNEQCDPALLFWLVEELLDTQTIDGCQQVFHFLESRRERITSKHFAQKKLVILRTCNELLRRLSRELNPAFCGRVFIFMFQSFPLGEKSSVNLRGEYHVENVTTWDTTPAHQDSSNEMDLDAEAPALTLSNGSKNAAEPKPSSKASSADGKKDSEVKAMDADELYPAFWALQDTFSQPKKLFDSQHFPTFKKSLEATMATFRNIKVDQGSRSKEKQDRQGGDSKRGSKRKWQDDEDELASGFNPKYLTSRDLFKLEIGDMSFRRNILVQALIIMEFLLSLSAKARERLAGANAPNKSVTYSDQTLSDKDTQWTLDMKKTIAEYLKQGPEGPFFYRMVETVLSRDKNWVRWKAENCPPIELPALSPQAYSDAMAAARKLATNKRLRLTPIGTLDLRFLDEEEGVRGMDRLKSCNQAPLPDLISFKRKIADDDLEINVPVSNESRAAAVLSKASNTWRALRMASKIKLALFEKIDDDDRIGIVFEEVPEEPEEDADVAGEDSIFPEDRRPIILVDAAKIDQAGLGSKLVNRHPGTFGRVAPHVTRQPQEAEVNGRDFHLVDNQQFCMIRDSDQFLEFDDETKTGTSRKTADAIMASGKVPILELDHRGAQQVKDNGYDARFIFIQPPSLEALELRRKESGASDEDVGQVMKRANEQVGHSATPGFYDAIHSDGNFKTLESTVFGRSIVDEDIPMADAVNGSGEEGT